MTKNKTCNLLMIGLVANIFEAYEFLTYAYLADVIGQLFFKTNDPVSRLIQAFAIFMMGYLIKPLGSVFFGILGDRIGRAIPLKISLIMMGSATFAIGLLPTYSTMSAFAPVLLLALRLIQGFSSSGEYPTNACYVFEAATLRHRSILCSVVTASISLGFLLASLIAYLIFLVFDRPTILSWAWRIPFLLSFPMTLCIYMIRSQIQDYPIQPENDRAPTFSSLKIPLFKLIPIMSFLSVSGFILLGWMPHYLIYFLNYPPQLARLVNIVCIGATVPCYLAAGVLVRFLGYRLLTQVGLMMTILSVYPLFIGLQQPSLGRVLVIQFLLAFFVLGSVGGVSKEMFGKQFLPFVRCRGMNLATHCQSFLLADPHP